MIELPFDPYESQAKSSQRKRPMSARGRDDDPLVVLRRQAHAWFFGWLFYSFGLFLLLAVTIHVCTNIADSDTFVIGLALVCGWLGGFLQFRFPIGGPRGAPTRAEKREAALGPNYKIGKALLGAGVMIGTATVLVSCWLSPADRDDSIVSTIVLVVGQGLGAGCIFLGRRMMSKAKEAAEKPSAT